MVQPIFVTNYTPCTWMNLVYFLTVITIIKHINLEILDKSNSLVELIYCLKIEITSQKLFTCLRNKETSIHVLNNHHQWNGFTEKMNR